MITVGQEEFKTKKALQERVRGILWSYKPGQTLLPDHFTFILALLRNHEFAEGKIGPGVSSFVVASDDFSSQGFRAVRVDGRVVPFSYLSCITKRKPGEDFKRACRHEVFEQICNARDIAFATGDVKSCPVTGESITTENCHVDHAPPNTFEVLIGAFTAERKLDITAVATRSCGVGVKELVDRALAEQWRAFHRQHARLRVVSKRANLSDIKKQHNANR